jgi:hypothetical protein
MDSTPKKSILRFEIILLFVLVLIDKGTSLDFPKNLSIPKTVSSFQISKLSIPEISEDPVGFEFSQKGNVSGKLDSIQGVYFLKFKNRGKRVVSTLVRVPRSLKGSLKKRVWSALLEIAKGPTLEEQSRGVISGFPSDFGFRKKIRLKKGILQISLPSEFEENTGRDLMKDRTDQLVYTLLEFPEIKGVKLYKDTADGWESQSHSPILIRSERRVLKLDTEGLE